MSAGPVGARGGLPGAEDGGEPAAAAQAPAPLVLCEGLRYRWPGGPPVIDLERFAVAPGERVFVEGPSGCGKTTLLGLLAGVLVPEAGSVQVAGTRLEAMGGMRRDRFRGDHLGYIFQLFNLLPYLSVVENVTLACRFSPRRRRRAGARSGSVVAEARRLLEHLDLGGPDVLSRPVTALSVGQQQRVAAARALIGSPDLVIADEPTSALDPDRREAFAGLLFQECAAAGSALVFVSHDRSLAPLFHRVVHLPDLNRAAPG